ncbi:hypothetical protein LJR220_003051 [Bradyrhizobium sp. LjRoot220]|uniref:hypothetical protein n=1 Tax=Bradyrhizobium sp. LjRoot220 TaxID=3342284 RepID=UPI003ECC5B79
MADRERIRINLRTLDRTALREVARVTAIPREELEDFALVGLDLGEDAMGRLELWHADFALKQALVSPGNMTLLSFATEATGILPKRISDFVNGLVELTEDEKTDLRDLVMGRYGRSGVEGKFTKTNRAAVTVMLGNASASVDPECSRRAEALRTLSTLNLEQLEGLARRVV